MRKMIVLLLLVGIILGSTIAVDVGEGGSLTITGPLDCTGEEGGSNPTPCGGEGGGGGGLPG